MLIKHHGEPVGALGRYSPGERIHQTLCCTLATAAGVMPKLWELADMAQALKKWEARGREAL